MTEVFIPTLMVTVIGGITGVILALASKYLSVPVDEKIEQLREILPGVNCGACGYAGCDEYAMVLKNEDVATNLCIPGGDSTSQEISIILGKPYLDVEELTAQVHCVGDSFNSTYVMDYASKPTCKDANSFFQGTRTCTYACLGFGDCVNACVYGAISIIDNIAVIDRNLCTGCKMCEPSCPNDLIVVNKSTNKVFVGCSSEDKGAFVRKTCKVGCIACKFCEKACKVDAIKVVNNYAIIDPDLCTNCGDCVAVCPTNVIKNYNLS